jgi:tetratricopeptide (TPR) repeat protein
MSFAGWNQEAGSRTPAPAARPKSRGGLLALSAAGAFALIWLSRRLFPDAHHLPTDFAGRLHALAPSFAAFAAGLFCVFSVAFLYRDWEAGASARRAASTGEAPPARAKLSKTARALLLIAYVVAGSVMMSIPYIAILWPAKARAIGLIGVVGFAAIVVIGILLRHYGQTTHIARGVDEVGRAREPWKISTPVLVASGFALMVAGTFALHFAARRYAPVHAHTIVTVGIALMACALGVFIESLKGQKTPAAQSTGGLTINGEAVAVTEDAAMRAARQRKTRKQIAVFVFEGLVALLLASHAPNWVKQAVLIGHVVVIGLAVMALRRLRFWIYTVGHAGEFDRALRLNRLAMQIPGYGDSLEGPILFNAGRYAEALAFLKPLAFDGAGNPRFGSTDFYTYCLALNNVGKPDQAEKLLDSAVHAVPQADAFKVALASCLLTQEKDADRACTLLEEATATPQRREWSYGQRADNARRTARYAWALAGAGRSRQATEKIQQALAEGANLQPADRAGVLYFVGEAWRMLGDTSEARNAFNQAMEIRPDGVTALSARKGLAKLPKQWSE